MKKIQAVSFTGFVDSKYFTFLMPCASHHSSPPHQTKHQPWHCLCYACPFHPCTSFSTEETLPYVTAATTLPVLKVPITSLHFLPASLLVMPKQQVFVTATQHHSGSTAQLLPFALPVPGVAVSCPASPPLLPDGDEAFLLLAGGEVSVPGRVS